MMRSKSYLCLLIIAACARAPSGTSPAPEPERTPARSDNPVIDAGRSSWTFSPVSESRSYIVVESTTVSLGARSDSSTIRTAFTVATERLNTETSVHGTLDQVTGPGTELHEIMPVPFSGTIQGGGLAIDSIRGQRLPTVLMCDSPAMSQLSVIRRNLFIPPSTLSRNQSWTDSTTTRTCSGSVPVQVTSVRTYRVLGESGGEIVVERQDRLLSSGEGAQGQHRITIQSRGTGSSQLRLDRNTGELVSSAGVIQMEVDVGSSGRLQRFVQVVRDRLTRQ